jgi:outer membrane protein OmpU
MKKILLASTALVGFAGAAAAEVSVTGAAEAGITGGSGAETQFHQDIEVTFTMTGESDGGLSFGASVQLDEGGTTGAGTVTTDDQGYAIFLSGDFGTVTLGDTDGALDWALTEAGNVANPGSIADDETGHSGYFGSYLDGSYDGQIVRYNNTIGDFGFAISVEMDDSGASDNGYAVGFKYSADLGGTTLNFGLGYQDTATRNATGFSVTAALDSGLTAGFTYTELDGGTTAQNGNHMGIGYSMDAISVHANYGKFDYDDGSEAEGFGISAAYDLGGGLSAHLGLGDSSTKSAAGVSGSSDSFSLGLAMSF